MFKISDKVVCVHRFSGTITNCPHFGPFASPIYGQVYVVRASWSEPHAEEKWLINLVGFPDVLAPGWNRPMGFTPSRFRLLSEVQEENRLKATAEATT